MADCHSDQSPPKDGRNIDANWKRSLSFIIRRLSCAPLSTLARVEWLIKEEMEKDDELGSPWVFSPVPGWQDLFGSRPDTPMLAKRKLRQAPHELHIDRGNSIVYTSQSGRKYFCNCKCARCEALPCLVPTLRGIWECKRATRSWIESYSSVLELSSAAFTSDVGQSVCRFPCSLCGTAACRRFDQHPFVACCCLKCLYEVESGRRRSAYLWQVSPLIIGRPCSTLSWCSSRCALCMLHECCLCTTREPYDCRCIRCRRMVGRNVRAACVLDEVD